MATSDRGISLRREELQRVFVPNRGDVFRLRITTEDEVLMPRHVFAHQRSLVDPYEGTQSDEFCFVASPFDSVIYPIDEPDLLQIPQFFRKDTIDVLLPSTELADEFWEAVHDQVCNLVDAYNRLDDLRLVETARCGADVAPTESASESGSESESVEVTTDVYTWIGSGNWSDDFNWSPNGTPAANWLANLINTDSPGGISAIVNQNYTVTKVVLQGDEGSFALEIPDGITLTVTDEFVVNDGGILTGAGNLVGNLVVNGGTVSP